MGQPRGSPAQEPTGALFSAVFLFIHDSVFTFYLARVSNLFGIFNKNQTLPHWCLIQSCSSLPINSSNSESFAMLSSIERNPYSFFLSKGIHRTHCSSICIQALSFPSKRLFSLFWEHGRGINPAHPPNHPDSSWVSLTPLFPRGYEEFMCELALASQGSIRKYQHREDHLL